MFSKILVKLIDESIIPAVLLLGAKLVSIVLICNYYDIDYTIGGSGFSFSSTEDYLLVNSYSTLSMILVLAIGLFYVLLKSYMFHSSHITPGMTAKMFSLKLSAFIQSSFDLYTQGSVWISYSYLLLIISGLMSLFGLLYPWVFVVSLLMTILSSILLILDVENEMVISKKNSPEYDQDKVYLEGEDDENL